MASFMDISGRYFGMESSLVRAYLTPAHGSQLEAKVISVSGTVLKVSIETLSDSHHGSMTAMITHQGIKSNAAQVSFVSLIRPVVGPVCADIDNSGQASTCDTNGDGTFSDACTLNALCASSQSSNGGCGASGRCSGHAVSIAQSGTGSYIEIRGARFGSVKDHIHVTFSPALPGATIHNCSDTLLLVRVPSTNVATGALQALVTHSSHGSSDPMKTIGNVVGPSSSPWISPSNLGLISSATLLTISGGSFGTSSTNIRVYLEGADGWQPHASVNTVTDAAIVLTVTLLSDRSAGLLRARVTRHGLSSSLTTVATIQGVAPAIQQSTFRLSKSAAGNLLEIMGTRFGSDNSALTLTFTPAVSASSKEIRTDSMLLVSLGDTTSSLFNENLQVTITSSLHGSSGFPVNIGTFVSPANTPIITASSVTLESFQTTLTIHGDNFGSVATNARVYLYPAVGVAPAVEVVACVNTMITVTVTGLNDSQHGTLQAVVTIQALASSSTSVANVVKVQPKPASHFCVRIDENSVGSTCDTNGDEIFGEVCEIRSPCNSAAGSNGGCGSSGVCQSHALVNIAKSTVNRVEIYGHRFSTDPALIRIVTDPLVPTTVITCANNLLVVDLGSTTSLATSAALFAQIYHTSTGVSNKHQIGTIVAGLTNGPALSLNSAVLETTASSLVVTGQSFGTNPDELRIYLMTTAGVRLTTIVQSSPSVAANQFTLKIIGMSDLCVGVLNGMVTLKGVKTEWTAVSTIVNFKPIITPRAISLASAASGSVLEIIGSNFGTDKNLLTINFSPAPVTASSIAICRDNLITVNMGDTTSSSMLGILKANISQSSHGVMQSVVVANIVGTAPVPTIVSSASSIVSTAEELTLHGSNLGINLEDVRIYLSSSSSSTTVLASVMSLNGGSFDIKISGLSDAHAGHLEADVTVRGMSTGATTTIGVVAAVRPVVSSGSFSVAQSSIGNIIEISGTRFHNDASNLAVVFTPTLSNVQIMRCTESLLIVNTGNTQSTAQGSLNVEVIHSVWGSSGTVVIGNIVSGISLPALTGSTTQIAASTKDITFAGQNLGSATNTVRAYLFPANGHYPVASVLSVSSNSVQLLIASMGDANLGILSAIVTVQGIPTAHTTVGIVAVSAPVVEQTNQLIAQHSSANSIEISGERFGSIASDLSIQFTPSLPTPTVIICTDTILLVTVGDITSSSLLGSLDVKV